MEKIRRQSAKFLRVLLLLALSATCSEALARQPTNPSDRYGDYDESLPLAQQGDPEHQYRLAVIYGGGHSVSTNSQVIEQDHEAAERWLVLSAGQGHKDAMYSLARGYGKEQRTGWASHGLELNHEKSFYWWSKLAETESGEAHYKVGLFYKDGLGVEEDMDKARRWFRSAAVDGDPDAAIELGEDVLSYRQILEAAEEGSIEDQKILALIYFNAEGLQKDLEESFKWYRAAARQGDMDSMFFLGIALGSEDNPGSREEAVDWMKLAAKGAYVDRKYTGLFASDFVGFAYREGHGVEKSKYDAVKWFFLAYEQGSGEAKGAIEELMSEASLERDRNLQQLLNQD